MSTYDFLSESVEQTMKLGEAIGELCQPGDVLTLDGELGAGKTQFVRGLAQGLGLDPAEVSSPTFVILHEYRRDDIEDSTASVLLHMDAYRITGPDDLASVGFDDEAMADAVSVIEWADRVSDILPADRLELRLEHAENNTRKITLHPHGDWRDRINRLNLESLDGPQIEN